VCLATSAGCLRVQAAGRLLKVQMMLAALLPGSSTRPDQPSCLTRPACVCSWVPAQTSRMCGGRALSLWRCLLTGQRWQRCCCRRGQTPTVQVGVVLLTPGCGRMAAYWLLLQSISQPVSGVLQRPVASVRRRMLPAGLPARLPTLPSPTCCCLQTHLAPLPSGTAASSMRWTAYQVRLQSTQGST
jgi:hypothetical protein